MREIVHGVEGRLYRHKRCGFVRRVDVPYRVEKWKETDRFGAARTKYGRKDYSGEPAQNEQNYARWPERFAAPVTCHCAEVGSGFSVPYSVVKGVVNERERCGAKCMASKGPDCECSCGGANHGGSYR